MTDKVTRQAMDQRHDRMGHVRVRRLISEYVLADDVDAANVLLDIAETKVRALSLKASKAVADRYDGDDI